MKAKTIVTAALLIVSAVYQPANAQTLEPRAALLITMEDGGLSASYLAVVDLLRGEVFFRRWVRILANNGDTIVLGFYREEDWGDLAEGKKVRPYKRERHNLKTLLLRPAIVNKKENPGS
jgi:hypothetical protein